MWGRRRRRRSLHLWQTPTASESWGSRSFPRSPPHNPNESEEEEKKHQQNKTRRHLGVRRSRDPYAVEKRDRHLRLTDSPLDHHEELISRDGQETSAWSDKKHERPRGSAQTRSEIIFNPKFKIEIMWIFLRWFLFFYLFFTLLPSYEPGQRLNGDFKLLWNDVSMVKPSLVGRRDKKIYYNLLCHACWLQIELEKDVGI